MYFFEPKKYNTRIFTRKIDGKNCVIDVRKLTNDLFDGYTEMQGQYYQDTFENGLFNEEDPITSYYELGLYLGERCSKQDYYFN